MKIGTVITLPINKDTSCIVINKKTYGELRRNFIDSRKFPKRDFVDSQKFLDTASSDFHPRGRDNLYIFTFARLYSLGHDDDESMCYQLLFGDEKAWIRQHTLNKYVLMIRIEI